jgi:UDP-N-acetylmuramoyl-L-alanyl-D-glutamate--2,6-diaminopimelate ligase
VKLSRLVTLAARRSPQMGWATVAPTGHGPDDPEITAIRFDSRAVEPGDLFVALVGERSDGHAHATAAVDAGAAALLVQRRLGSPEDPAPFSVPQIIVDGTRPAMAMLACTLERDPTAELFAVGITGTNGKTTTTHLTASILDHAGVACGQIGTLTGERTTPESPDLQHRLRGMVDSGFQAVAMEVSSHSLVQDRVLGARFDVGVFTNLSPDHLDYHGTMEAYFSAKASMFRTGMISSAVVNGDDPWGRRLVDELRERPALTVRVVTAADAEDLVCSIDGSTFRWRGQDVRLAIPGRFNVDNAIAAAEAARFAGVSDAAIAAGLSAAGQVPGRFEIVARADATTDRPTVVVDYAHTPDGLAKVLEAVRELAPEAGIAVVFGCGGDRDREKRPLMGAAAAAGADHVIVTSDNPRSEDPDEIIAAIVAGLSPGTDQDIEPDRAAAIRAAIAGHGAGDVVVIAGKGHEVTQTIGASVLPFDDREVARQAIATGAAGGAA